MTNYNEVKSTIAFEAPHERDIETLARTRADCAVKITRCVCTQEMCNNCDINKKLNYCYSQMPACDQLRVENLTLRYASNAVSAALNEQMVMGELSKISLADPKKLKWLPLKILLRAVGIGLILGLIILGGVMLYEDLPALLF